MNPNDRSVQNARRRRLDLIQSRDRYPQFLVLPNDANTQWVDFISKKLQQLNFEDRRFFSEFESYFYRLHRSVGYETALKQLDELPDPGKVDAFKWSLRYCIGDIIFDSITDHEWDQFCPRGKDTNEPLPVHDVDIHPFEQNFAVRFSSLRRGPAGHYTSPREITCNIDGKTRIVEFRAHAIERISQRLTGYARKFGSWGDAYAFIERCNYFEEVRLVSNQRALTFYQDCFLEQNSPHMFHYPSQYAYHTFGFLPQYLNQKHGVRWYFRVGYCPIKITDTSVVLITTLPPGYNNTPECGLITSSNISEEERMALIRKADHWTAEVLHKTMDFSLFQWFHEKGIEQVVPFEGDLFVDVLPGTTPKRPRRISIETIPRASK